jgi:hypothetical protein
VSGRAESTLLQRPAVSRTRSPRRTGWDGTGGVRFQPPEPLEVDYRRPAWIQPPEDVVPGVAPVEPVLAAPAAQVMRLTGIRAYPNGFARTLYLRLRHIIPGEQSLFGIFDMFGTKSTPWASCRLLAPARHGVADGRKATNLERRHDFEDGPASDPPALWLTR